MTLLHAEGIVMKSKTLNSWLTLCANFGVLIGLILLLVELDQNATVMKAQISNERSSQGIELFMSVAESPELSEIDAILLSNGFPENDNAISQLSEIQKNQYIWFLKARQAHVENVLYQQALGVVHDPVSISEAWELVRKLEVFGLTQGRERIRNLIAQAEAFRE